jgi:hypothetical protein
VDYFVYAVALLLVAAVALFVKVAFFDKRPQKTAFVLAVLSVPVFLIYYADRWPSAWGNLPMRKAVSWLSNFDGADPDFKSDLAPAYLMAILLIIHLLVLQRVAVGNKIERLQDPIAQFFGSAFLATMIGGIFVTALHWGWTGALIVGVVYTLVYLGVIAFLASIVEIIVELAKLAVIWLKRQAFRIATAITRGASFVSSLGGRLGLSKFADKIREQQGAQEQTFQSESDQQDKELYAAFLRDRASQRKMAGRSDEEVAAEIAELSAPEVLPEEEPAAPKQPRSRKKSEPVAETETPAVTAEAPVTTEA